jgi:uncharacterized protein
VVTVPTAMTQELVDELADRAAELRDEFGVTSLFLFGSAARGDHTPDSDVDLLVEFERPIGLLRFVGLKLRLEEILGRAVDLVEPTALHPRLRDRILSEAVRAA